MGAVLAKVRSYIIVMSIGAMLAISGWAWSSSDQPSTKSGIDSLLKDGGPKPTVDRYDMFRKIEKLASEGNANAIGELGNYYYKGFGTKKNIELGNEKIEKSASLGSPLGMYYKCGLLADIGEMSEAIPLCEAAALKGLGPAYVSLSWYYISDKYGMIDYGKAIEYAKIAAFKYKQAEGKSNLAYLYQNGLGVDKSYKKAIDIYKELISQGPHSPQAEFNLGEMYYHGNGVERDEEIAAGYYREVVGYKGTWEIDPNQLEVSKLRLRSIQGTTNN
jgi:TPR repeat protein